MILVINIGNSNIRFGLFDKENPSYCKKSWVIPTKPYKDHEQYFIILQNEPHLKGSPIKEIIIGSVVPPLNSPISNALEFIYGIKPIFVDKNTLSPIRHHSKQLGTDLYANATMAYYLNNKSPNLIIDFGTALTFTLIDKKGDLEGVVIAPGIEISLRSLVDNTAQLKKVSLEKPSTILGDTTKTAMQSGMVYGFLSMVEGMIDRIKKETHHSPSPAIIITGGLSSIYGPLLKGSHLIDKLHTIKGIYLLYLLNK